MLPLADCVNEACSSGEQAPEWLVVACLVVLGIAFVGLVALIIVVVVEMWKGEL